MARPAVEAASPKGATSPSRSAFQRIQGVLARGAGPDRMPREVDAIVARPRETGDGEEAQGWPEELRDGFAENVGPAYEAIERIESTGKGAPSPASGPSGPCRP